MLSQGGTEHLKSFYSKITTLPQLTSGQLDAYLQNYWVWWRRILQQPLIVSLYSQGTHAILYRQEQLMTKKRRVKNLSRTRTRMISLIRYSMWLVLLVWLKIWISSSKRMQSSTLRASKLKRRSIWQKSTLEPMRKVFICLVACWNSIPIKEFLLLKPSTTLTLMMWESESKKSLKV